MPQIQESTLIKDVQIVTLRPIEDKRGRFIETFRKEWFPQRTWQIIQTNRSDSRTGVLRGLHYHFHQIDYWYVVNGRIQAALVDMRPSSPTYGATQTLSMGEENQLGLFIPNGIAHGFVALTDATLTYIVDNYHDNRDEFGVAWDDPDVAMPWDVTSPVLSSRDAMNPKWKEIPPEKLPV
jgi:dTDP-4-dehydrorhamnose 3,5-epimerase